MKSRLLPISFFISSAIAGRPPYASPRYDLLNLSIRLLGHPSWLREPGVGRARVEGSELYKENRLPSHARGSGGPAVADTLHMEVRCSVAVIVGIPCLICAIVAGLALVHWNDESAASWASHHEGHVQGVDHAHMKHGEGVGMQM